MPSQTDRGYAVLAREDDGTTSVVVCADAANGKPSHPYAVHSHRGAVVVDSAVRLVSRGATRHTVRPVEVFTADDGSIQVRALSDASRVLQSVRSRTSIPASAFSVSG